MPQVNVTFRRTSYISFVERLINTFPVLGPASKFSEKFSSSYTDSSWARLVHWARPSVQQVEKVMMTTRHSLLTPKGERYHYCNSIVQDCFEYSNMAEVWTLGEGGFKGALELPVKGVSAANRRMYYIDDSTSLGRWTYGFTEL
ncbi:hypothetical protein CC2G_007658 [Coprinopsis cinerea AmutBmut pab1-1]|nr:hypothetical protein CC2G_007658 [Coprinopsis cinerea AmutBmut pab1-1]